MESHEMPDKVKEPFKFPKPEDLDFNTWHWIHEWARHCGHYQTVQALERFRKAAMK